MNTDRILEYIDIGKNDFDWYADCTELFIKLFGVEQLDIVCKLFAATSINTSLKANITLFRKAYYELLNDKPVGWRKGYLPNIHNNIQLARDGKDLSGRKINSFARAMSGDTNAVVVDIWLCRAFGLDLARKEGKHAGKYGSPSDKQYDIIEAYCRDLAPRLKYYPCQISAMIWAGARITHTGDRNTHYKQQLEYQLTNLFNCI